ncbi:MAG: hypothetical protein WD138_04750, partial [Halofilum sp. (in: g-proteobacteria)]
MLRNLPRRLLLLLLLLPVTAAWSANGGGQAAIPRADVREADAAIHGIEEAMRARAEPDIETLRGFLSDIPDARSTANQCINDNQGALDRVRNQLETLGRARDEAIGVQQQRASLQERQASIERQLQLCRVIQLRANELEQRITHLQQQRLAERLMQRDPPAWDIAAENLSEPRQWWSTAKLFLVRDSGLPALSPIELVTLVGLILLGVGGSLYARQALFAVASRMRGGTTLTGGFLQAVTTSAASNLPALVTSLAVALYLTAIQWGQASWPFITILSYGLSGFFGFQFLVRTFLAPVPPAKPYLPAPEDILRALAARMRTLGLLILLVSIVSATLVIESFPEPVRNLLRLVFATVLIVDLAWVIWLTGGLLRWHETRGPRLMLVAIMVGALIAEWTGYHNLAEYIVTGVVGTLVSFGLAWLVWRLFD